MDEKEYKKFLNKKFGFVGGLNKIYRVIIIENGEKKSIYDFDTEEEATQCYGLLFNYNTENKKYLQNEEVFLTIYYSPSV